MHHDRDPAQWPEPMPQAEGLPPLSMEQLQALAQMAQAMTAMNNQPAITSLTVPGVTVLPGQIQVIGITDLQSLVDEFLDNKVARGRKQGTLTNYKRALGRLVEVCAKLPVTPADRGRYGLKSGCDIAWEGAPPSGILVVRPPDAGDPRCAFPANAIRCKKRLNRIYLTSPSHN